MRKILFALVALIVFAACGDKASNEIPFEVARNYFFTNDAEALPISPKITSDAEFNKYFGMAATMGEDGSPTEIDFSRQFVLAIVLPVTDYATEINPVKLEARGDTLVYTHEIKRGEKQTYSIQPISIIIVDKRHERQEVLLVAI